MLGHGLTFATRTVKVKNDHRSKFSSLSNWKEEAFKASTRFEPVTSAKYRCDALPTEL